MATLTLDRKLGPGKTARAGRRTGGEAHGLEPRVAKLEATTEHIQRDVARLEVTVEKIQRDVAKLEVATEHIQRDVTDLKTEVRGLRAETRADFRLLLGANVSVAVGLGGLMAKGFGWY